MTYSVHAVTAITEIPALVKAFADTLGFTTTRAGATSVTVKHPTYTGARTFRVFVDNEGTGGTLRERIAVGCDAPGANKAWAESPKLNRTQANLASAVAIERPSKLYLFGALSGGAMDSGSTFIAGVIEYGYNLYRHFYLGYAEKITGYRGGEIITGSAFWPVQHWSSSTGTLEYDAVAANGYLSHAYPFSSANSRDAAYFQNGGMYIDHAANPSPWREFANNGEWGSSGLDASFRTYGGKLVLGGFKDSINSGYMAAGKAAYAGVQMLTPVNLYIGKQQSGSQYFQAVGRPAGVRMVHMEDLEPGAQVTVGSSVWQVFPVFSKSEKTASTKDAAVGAKDAGFPSGNTSRYVGMAYLVSA